MEEKWNIQGILDDYIYEKNTAYGEYDRFYSWNICYNKFQEYFKKPEYLLKNSKLSSEDADYLALHLGMYLASWGMMRGSANLLQYSYRIHIPIVNLLFKNKEKIIILYEYIFKDNIIFTTYNEATKKDANKSYRTWKPNTSNTLSDTLTTKILLGSFGICPAYDKYFKQGIEYYNNLKNSDSKTIDKNFSADSLSQLAEFYEAHKADFQAAAEKYKKELDYDFPPMKLVDMYFWQLGFENKPPKN